MVVIDRTIPTTLEGLLTELAATPDTLIHTPEGQVSDGPAPVRNAYYTARLATEASRGTPEGALPPARPLTPDFKLRLPNELFQSLRAIFEIVQNDRFR